MISRKYLNLLVLKLSFMKRLKVLTTSFFIVGLPMSVCGHGLSHDLGTECISELNTNLGVLC